MPAPPHAADPEPDPSAGDIVCHLDHLLTERGMTVAELSRSIGITQANLSVLKNNRARAIRFSTLAALCHALGCQPGDLFSAAEPPPAAD